MFERRLALVAAILCSAPLQAQRPEQVPLSAPQTATAPGMSFDVASIRPSKPGTPAGLKLESGRFSANFTLFGYITFAWNLMPSTEQKDSMLARVPKWVSTDNFEVQAVAAGNPTKDQMRLMVQALLADRFRLRVHTVSPETAVLALILNKPGATGPALRPHAEGRPCSVPSAPQDSRKYDVGVFPPMCGEFVALPRPRSAVLVAGRDVTMEQIATFVSSLGTLTRTVVDQTGLRGRFDFTIEFTPDRTGPAPPRDTQPDDSQITTLQEAVGEQLGLKLKATKAPLETLVVDHVERPSEN
jgi:uncharacterized protein (TIGR03435 family)